MRKEQEEQLLVVLDNLVDSVKSLSEALDGVMEIVRLLDSRIEALEERTR